jgi:hypothetical protein
MGAQHRRSYRRGDPLDAPVLDRDRLVIGCEPHELVDQIPRPLVQHLAHCRGIAGPCAAAKVSSTSSGGPRSEARRSVGEF